MKGKKLAKLLMTLIIGLGVVGSTFAQAQSLKLPEKGATYRWVTEFVTAGGSGFYSNNGDRGTGHDLCELYVASRNSKCVPWQQVNYINWYSMTSGGPYGNSAWTTCKLQNKNTQAIEMGHMSIVASCPTGQGSVFYHSTDIYPQFGAGCFEKITATENCENKQVLDDGTVLCGKPKPKLECPKDPPKDYKGRNAYGALFCGGDEFLSCVWDNPNLASEEARERAKACTLKHEQVHKDYATCFGTVCPKDGGVAEGEGRAQYRDEILANMTDFVCIQKAYNDGPSNECKNDEICLKAYNDDLTKAANVSTYNIDQNFCEYLKADKTASYYDKVKDLECDKKEFSDEDFNFDHDFTLKCESGDPVPNVPKEVESKLREMGYLK